MRPNIKPSLRVDNDARTGMPPGIPGGAMCVQRFDDSRNSAIRITYRISLRSSSMPEPRDPLLKVLLVIVILRRHYEEIVSGLLTGAGQGRKSPAVRLKTGPPKQHGKIDKGWRWGPEDPNSIMILPQVHLRNGLWEMSRGRHRLPIPESSRHSAISETQTHRVQRPSLLSL